MSFRFFRRINIIPGLTLNLSKSGPSLSVGPRGAKHTIGRKGTTTTVGLPGTGFHYTKRRTRKVKSDQRDDDSGLIVDRERRAAEDVSTIGNHENADGAESSTRDGVLLLRALLAFERGRLQEACSILSELDRVSDAAWLKGMIHLQQNQAAAAAASLEEALDRSGSLGALFSLQKVTANVSLPITPEISTIITPNETGTLLALAEAYQRQGDLSSAHKTLSRRIAKHGCHPIVAISIAEITLEAIEHHMPVSSLETIKDCLQVESTDPVVSATLLLYCARCHLQGDDYVSAIEAYEKVKAEAPSASNLQKTAWYELALTYLEMGDGTSCRKLLAGLYAIDRDFADVADRLTKRSKIR